MILKESSSDSNLIQIQFKSILNCHRSMIPTRFLRDYVDMDYCDMYATSTVKGDKNESKLGNILLHTYFLKVL